MASNIPNLPFRCIDANDTMMSTRNLRLAWERMLQRYPATVLVNSVAYLIPALYATLSKLWVASIDWSMVATSDTYTYMGIIAEIVNEGLPRASFNLIGDTSKGKGERLQLVSTLLLAQTLAGLALTVVFLAAAPAFVSAFTYVWVCVWCVCDGVCVCIYICVCVCVWVWVW